MTSKEFLRLIAIASAPMMLTAMIDAAVITVPANQPTIQAGINAAANGDTVLVGPGYYAEAIVITGKSITVASSDGPKTTVISSNGQSASTVKFEGGLQSGSVLRGFQITGGHGTVVGSNRYGGGIYLNNAVVTIQECEIVFNSVSPPFSIGDAYGGGVYATTGPLVMLDCLVAHNTASAPFAGAGGVLVDAGTSVFRRCVFQENTTAGYTVMGIGGGSHGGGAAVGNASFINCAFIKNGTFGQPVFGGGVSGGGNTFVNCLFTGNKANGGNGGASFGSSSMYINCTIAENTMSGGGTGGVHGPTNLTLRNCIAVGNSGAQISTGAIVTTSCVQGGYAGEGNIDVDPLFVDQPNGDYHLASGSPVIDMANLLLLPSDTGDLDADGNTAEYIPYALAYYPLGFPERRIVNGYLDIGAYEWQHACVADVSPSSPGVAGDGTINAADLLAVINGWGTCDGCVADINGDGTVNTADLLLVINGWGKCP